MQTTRLQNQKGQAGIAAVVMTMVGITIAVILVANVVMQSTFQPTQPDDTSLTNSTALTNLNVTPRRSHTFVTGNVDTTQGATLNITFQGIGAAGANLTQSDGTVIGTFGGAQGTSVVAVTATLLTNGGNTIFNYSHVPALNGNSSNVTSATLLYYQRGNFYSWDSGTQAMWLLVGIALVAALILFIFKGGQA